MSDEMSLPRFEMRSLSASRKILTIGPSLFVPDSVQLFQGINLLSFFVGKLCSSSVLL